MGEKRRHHYVPQFYLRGFADPTTPKGQKPCLWVRDIRSGIIEKRTPSNLAVESGCYALDTDTGRDYRTLENELAKMEAEAALALREFLRRPVGSRGAIDSVISAFVAWQACRIPWFRRIALDGWPRLLEDVAWGRADLEDYPGASFLLVNESTGVQVRLPQSEALAAIRSGAWKARMTQNQYLDVLRWQRWFFQHERFSRLSWIVLTAPVGRSFITSDRPVTWWAHDTKFADALVALKHPDVELTIPLNSQTALLATGSPIPPDTPVRIDDVNMRTWLLAERFVAAPDVASLESCRERHPIFGFSS
jgi:hypothetical protein